MANWQVAKYEVEVFPHPNADKLELVRAGEFQLVSGKGVYKTGDVVIVAPDKSVLSNGDMIREYEKYLSGAKKNKVKQAQLRGEISQGITWPTDQETLENTFGGRIADLITAAPLGEDISELMGITKYEPPIPAALAGQVRGITLSGKTSELNHTIYMHDCYQWGAFAKEFDPEENVVITEKVHGSLCSYTVVIEDGVVTSEVVSSKGQLKRGLQIIEAEGNAYWQAVRNTRLRAKAEDIVDEVLSFLPDDEGPTSFVITITSEVVPVQAGFSYGFTRPEALVYDVEVNGVHVPLFALPESLLDVWVPVVYEGKLKDADVYALSKGKETVSGKELHIREGVVVTPQTPRNSTRGNFNLALKVINPKYAEKETGEEIN